jgi:hypothetical protein
MSGRMRASRAEMSRRRKAPPAANRRGNLDHDDDMRGGTTRPEDSAADGRRLRPARHPPGRGAPCRTAALSGGRPERSIAIS